MTENLAPKGVPPDTTGMTSDPKGMTPKNGSLNGGLMQDGILGGKKNIEAIEEEKKEYLASKDVHQGGASSSSSPSVEGDINTEGKEHPEDLSEEHEEGKDEIEEIVEEDTEVEIIEVSFDEEEINEWIKKLEELRENKEGHVHLEIDDENELLINYEKGENDTEY